MSETPPPAEEPALIHGAPSSLSRGQLVVYPTRDDYLKVVHKNRDGISSGEKILWQTLATVVALQAFINMGVAVSLLPTKGMTLPFISYGGSSLFAVALTMGFALAVTRQRSRIGETDCDLFAFLREPQPA